MGSTFPESTLQHYGSSVGSSWQRLQQKGSQRRTNIPRENLKKLQKICLFLAYILCFCVCLHMSVRVCPWDITCYKCTSCSLNMCNFATNSYFKKRRKYISIANFLLGFVFVHHSAKVDLCVCLFSYRCAFLTVLRSYEENSTSLALNVSKKTMNESHLSSSLVWKLQQSRWANIYLNKKNRN